MQQKPCILRNVAEALCREAGTNDCCAGVMSFPEQRGQCIAIAGRRSHDFRLSPHSLVHQDAWRRRAPATPRGASTPLGATCRNALEEHGESAAGRPPTGHLAGWPEAGAPRPGRCAQDDSEPRIASRQASGVLGRSVCTFCTTMSAIGNIWSICHDSAKAFRRPGSLPNRPWEIPMGQVGNRTPLGSIARIGRTPLLRIRLRINRQWKHLWLKLEQFNPGGSIKDRTALALLEDLEQRGKMRHSDTIVESTSGNLGVALAMACHERGYHFVAVVDPMASERCVKMMTQLGADVERVSPPAGSIDYLSLRLVRVQELLDQNPTWRWADQYRSPANPRAHEQHTGPEILKQVGNTPEAVFVSVSTGGTLAGISRFLRACVPSCTIGAVDIQGSAALGGIVSKRHIPGIGSTRRSRFLSGGCYDFSVEIPEAVAISTCHAFREATNIGLGGSSGAVVAAAAQYLSQRTSEHPVVCICPDGSDRYEDTLYEHEWLLDNGLKVDIPGLTAFDDADCL